MLIFFGGGGYYEKNYQREENEHSKCDEMFIVNVTNRVLYCIMCKQI